MDASGADDADYRALYEAVALREPKHPFTTGRFAALGWARCPRNAHVNAMFGYSVVGCTLTRAGGAAYREALRRHHFPRLRGLAHRTGA